MKKTQEGISKKLEGILLLGLHKGRTAFKPNEQASPSIAVKQQL